MVYANPHGKWIITVEFIKDGSPTDRFESFASELPFICKQCRQPILYCYLDTSNNECENQEWLSRPFSRVRQHTLVEYIGIRSPLTCISSECLGPNGVPILEFYIENLISVANQ